MHPWYMIGSILILAQVSNMSWNVPENDVGHLLLLGVLLGRCFILVLDLLVGADHSGQSCTNEQYEFTHVASWYCWYSATKSCMLDSASVN
jgi:hypothetical protein